MINSFKDSPITSRPMSSSLMSRRQITTTSSFIAYPRSYPFISMDPTTLVINECMAMASAMRKMNRWSQSGVAAILAAGDIFGSNNGDDDDDGLISSLGITSSVHPNGKSSNENSRGGDYSRQGTPIGGRSSTAHRSSSSHDNPLLASFLQLKSILCEATSVDDIDSLTLLQPFLMVIKSSSTSGYITGLSLTAISKFLRYEIISLRSKNLQNSLIQIISSLTHCRFEAADQNTDDAILLKVLRLLEEIIQSHLSELLPNEVISEVVQTCLSLACNKKRSEVLRRAAEMAMVSITIKIFSKLKDIEPETEFVDELKTDFSETKLPEDIIGGTDMKPSGVNTPREQTVEAQEELDVGAATADKKEAIVESSNNQENNTEEFTEESYGIVCINEFLGILVSMISPSNQYQHMESTRVFALNLINTAIEVSGLVIAVHPALLTLVCDPISKYTLQIITTTDSPALLKASLQLFTTMAIVLGAQLKPQFELSLSLIFQSILPESTITNQSENIKGASISIRNPQSKELLIESLSLLWTKSPVFFTSLFIDYDCDFEKSDLATKILEFLCKLALPESAIVSTDNVPPICLEGILSFIDCTNERAKSLGKNKNLLPLHELIEQRKKKTAFVRCTDILNEKPLQGIKSLATEGFIKDENDLREVAEFFFSKSGRLNKRMLGEFLTKPSNSELFGHFIDLFDFTGLRVDEALRILLKTFRLPGESQQIARVVEQFATKYVSCYTTSESHQSTPSKRSSVTSENFEQVRPDAEAVFILSYSIIMLNTDLHNPQVKKQMTFEDYRRNIQGIYNGGDFPEWYVSKTYLTIKDREIIMPEEHHGTEKWFDDAWNNMVSTQDFNAAHQPEYDFSKVELCQFDKELFGAIVEKLIDTIFRVFKEASDDHIITRLMSSIDKIANICLQYGLDTFTDKLIDSLSELSSLMNPGAIQQMLNNDETVRTEIPITQIKIEKKNEEITVSDLAVWFGRDFKAQLSAVVLFRLIKKNDCRVSASWNKVIQIILRLLENCLVNPNLFSEFQKKIKLPPLPKVKPRFIIKKTKPLNNSGILSTFSSFLKGYSDEPPEPTDSEIESALSTIDCVKSLNIAGIFGIISKSEPDDLKLFVELLLNALPEHSEKTKRFYETETLFLLEVCVCFCLLLHEKSLIDKVLAKLDPQEISKKGQLRLVTYKLLLIRYSEGTDMLVPTIKSLETFDKEMVSKQGSQILQPLLSLVDDDSWCCKSLLNEEEYWKSLRLFGSIQIYANDVLQFVEGIILNASGDITPENYVSVLGLLDEISSLGAIGSQFEQENDKLGNPLIDNTYFNDLVQLSKRSIKLTSELGPIVRREEFSEKGMSYSLLQALAHQCFNPCREVRDFAVKSLQTISLSLENNDDISAFGIFEYGLLPLLTELTKLDIIQTDINGFSKTQFDSFSLVSKVFLKHIDDFKDNETEIVWMSLLENFAKLYELESKNERSGFIESGSELLKNMILVLQSNESLTEAKQDLWKSSWAIIGAIYPELKKEFNGEPVDASDVQEKEKEAEKQIQLDDEFLPDNSEQQGKSQQ